MARYRGSVTLRFGYTHERHSSCCDKFGGEVSWTLSLNLAAVQVLLIVAHRSIREPSGNVNMWTVISSRLGPLRGYGQPAGLGMIAVSGYIVTYPPAKGRCHGWAEQLHVLMATPPGIEVTISAGWQMWAVLT